MTEQITNFVSTTLNGGITNSATSLTVTSATGFPTSGNFRLVIQDAENDETNKEIVVVTGVSGSDFTITRGQESTSGVAHGNGSFVGHVLTAGGLDQWWTDKFTGSGSGVSVIHTDSATGSSPHSVTTTGVQSGDVALFVMSTRNSIPAAAGPEGGGWTQLWRTDVGSDEWVTAFYKVCGGSESSTWTWTHSAGSTVQSAVVIYRGIAGTLVHALLSQSRTAPCVLGSTNGLHIVVPQCCFSVASLALSDPASLLTTDINVDNNDQGIIIAHRDALFPAAQPQFVFSGGDSAYVGFGACVIE